MIQCGSRARFLREAMLSCGILQTRVKDFDGNLATETLILGFVNDAHAPASEFAPDDVARGEVHAD
jgi:hypothetical protein